MVKKIFGFFIILVSVALIIPLKVSAETDGFRGIKWGTDISTLKDMRYIRTDPSYGGIKLYSRNGDELKIGGAVLESIEYGFWQGKFSNLLIEFKGFTNYSALKDATFEKFGAGHKPNKFMEEYYWFGEITVMSIYYSEISSEGHLYMHSEEITKQQKRYEAEKAKKGAETGF